MATASRRNVVDSQFNGGCEDDRRIQRRSLYGDEDEDASTGTLAPEDCWEALYTIRYGEE